MIGVRSEVGRLRTALVHEPGPEVDRMLPAMMEQLLFDDILYGDRARDEHARFRRVLQLCGVEVLDAADLLEETLEQEPARRWVFDVMLELLSAAVRKRLEALSPAELARDLARGVRSDDGGRGSDVADLYDVAPLPNWCFQRDPQVALGNGLIISSMAAPARHREPLLNRLVFRHHPRFRDVPVWLDPFDRLPGRRAPLHPRPPCLEGGDVLVLSPDVLVVGLSERTNRTGVQLIIRALARQDDAPRHLVLVHLPRRRAYMHLDTVMTPVDRDACLVFSPVIEGDGSERAEVSHVDLHADDPRPVARAGLLEALRDLGQDLRPIPCGGEDVVAQQREQWTDGANALAVAPGAITLFDRNLATADELARQGFRVVTADDLLLGREEADVDEGARLCILLPSHEISRARGGPHCLVHPLLRDDLG